MSAANWQLASCKELRICRKKKNNNKSIAYEVSMSTIKSTSKYFPTVRQPNSGVQKKLMDNGKARILKLETEK